MQSQAVFSVTQINEYIKMTLESSSVLKSVFLRGEISNLKSNYSSGHMYFSLKDDSSSIRAVMFRSSASRLKFMPESGMRVIVHGKISSYTVSGDCQIIIDDIQPDGAGALAKAFEQLKAKLSAQGLFDVDKKKPIPQFPRTVGVITSASGAALHDIINVSGRRSPYVGIVIYPSYVQGELAPRSLIGGVKFFNDVHRVDVIIIGRGGGSAEDLWCFNDEGLAMAIAESDIPVISAVGHETDFTICDFVSDMRAPTPSAAAELAFPDTCEVIGRIKHLVSRAEGSMEKKLRVSEAKLDLFVQKLELHSPERVLSDSQAKLEKLLSRLEALQDGKLEKVENDFRVLCTRLEGVNPLSVLSHGYSVVESEFGEPITSYNDANIGESIKIILGDGALRASVTEKIKNDRIADDFGE